MFTFEKPELNWIVCKLVSVCFCSARLRSSLFSVWRVSDSQRMLTAKLVSSTCRSPSRAAAAAQQRPLSEKTLGYAAAAASAAAPAAGSCRCRPWVRACRAAWAASCPTRRWSRRSGRNAAASWPSSSGCGRFGPRRSTRTWRTSWGWTTCPSETPRRSPAAWFTGDARVGASR